MTDVELAVVDAVLAAIGLLDCGGTTTSAIRAALAQACQDGYREGYAAGRAAAKKPRDA